MIEDAIKANKLTSKKVLKIKRNLTVVIVGQIGEGGYSKKNPY